MAKRRTVGIVGGGLSGLLAGRILQARGLNVVVLDKGRYPGGRANTRKEGRHRFDHGAQFFTVRDPLVRPLLDSWIREGVVAEWTGRMALVQGREVAPAKAAARYVGVPGMIALARNLARGMEVRSGLRVESLGRAGSEWLFHDEDGSVLASSELAVVAVPAPQAVPLLSESATLQRRAQGVDMAPCWAGMHAFSEPLGLPFDGAFVRAGALSWIARDSSKPGREEGERWVLHAGPQWSRDHWEMGRTQAARALLEAFGEDFGPLPPASHESAHRWGFALTPDPVPDGAAFMADPGIGICGDWCLGGRIEGALRSGLDVAAQILGEEPSPLHVHNIISQS
jgi:predicted NAD/FAD-dependent oxidoreductase